MGVTKKFWDIFVRAETVTVIFILLLQLSRFDRGIYFSDTGFDVVWCGLWWVENWIKLLKNIFMFRSIWTYVKFQDYHFYYVRRMSWEVLSSYILDLHIALKFMTIKMFCWKIGVFSFLTSLRWSFCISAVALCKLNYLVRYFLYYNNILYCWKLVTIRGCHKVWLMDLNSNKLWNYLYHRIHRPSCRFQFTQSLIFSVAI